MSKKHLLLLVLFLLSLTNSYGGSSYTYTSIGILSDTENDKEALEYYEKGLKLYQDGKKKDGLKCIIKAIDIWDKEIDANATAGNACMLVGRIYLNNRQFTKAQIYAEKALDIVSEIYDIDNSIECAKAFRLLGETYFMQDKYDDAYMSFASSYEIAKKLLGEKHQEVKQIEILMTASFSKMVGK